MPGSTRTMSISRTAYNFYCRNREACVYFFPLLWLSLFIILFPACDTNRACDNNRSAFLDSMCVKAASIADSGSPHQAIMFIDSVYAGYPAAGVKDKFGLYAFKCRTYTHIIGAYDTATMFADSMLYLIEREGGEKKHPKQYAAGLYSKGDILLKQKNYSEAYRHFYKGHQVGKKILNLCTQSEYSYRLGMILYRQGHYTNAIVNFKQALAEGKDCRQTFLNFYRRQELLSNVALGYYKTGQADSALRYYEQALAYIDKNEGLYTTRQKFYDIARGVIYGNQGSAFLLKGEHIKAEELLNKSIEINGRKGFENRDADLNRLHLANLYYKEKRYTELAAMLQKVRHDLDSLPYQESELRWSELMWKYADIRNDVKEAYRYHLQYIHLKDSIARANRSLLESNTDEELQNLEKQYQIDLLTKDNELKKLYLMISLIASFMAVMIILMFLYNWRRSRISIKTLTRLNDQVNEQKMKLQAALAELEKRDREKDRIMRMVVHDLRNPIGGITGFADVMLLEKQHDTETKEMLLLIRNACADALSLINDILTASGSRNAQPLTRETVNLNALIGNNVDLLRYKAEEKHQVIKMLLPETPVMLQINREKISRVISNLLVNAIKFSPEGGNIIVQLTASPASTCMSFHDQGIGIPEDMQRNVFDIFTSAKRVGTAGERPFGLGLSICRQIVEEHGGKIWFESNTGKGTVFYVELSTAEQDQN